jgi:hypothetical protein
MGEGEDDFPGQTFLDELGGGVGRGVDALTAQLSLTDARSWRQFMKGSKSLEKNKIVFFPTNPNPFMKGWQVA